MVSSTFYDLQQVRADLTEFITNLGLRPLLSELPSFPIDPDRSTVANCRKRVDDFADIFVLVVGARYGSVPTDGRHSVTNLEYLTARLKGIPIYAFVLRRVLDLLPTWRANRTADFTHAVDDARLFEFVEELRGASGVWVHPFDTAQDITDVLRHQFAHLFQEALRLRALYFRANDRDLVGQMSPSAARLFLEKPRHWEYLLFFQLLADGVGGHSALLAAYDEKLLHGESESVSVEDALTWIGARNQEFQRLVDTANHLFAVSLQNALGPIGTASDPAKLYWCAATVADVLRHAVEWSQRVDRAHTPVPFDAVLKEMARAPDLLIAAIRRYPDECLNAIKAAHGSSAPVEGNALTLALVLEFNNLDGIQRAMGDARRWLEAGGT